MSLKDAFLYQDINVRCEAAHIRNYKLLASDETFRMRK